ncbi:alpha-humulene synthase-like [Carex rostrata]
MNSEAHKTCPAVCNSEKQEGFARRFFNYEPTSWRTDTFITHTAPIQKPKEWIEARIRELKEEVRTILGSTIDSVEMVNLIDTIEHLGIGYHFKRDIYDALSHLHDAKLVNCDLHHVATRFRLLRQHGFNASSDVFLNFKDHQGNFDENISKDPKGLLSLYNAGYLATPGEEILVDAISFARGHLSLMLDDLRSPLKKQVLRALKVPLHKMLVNVEARFYIEEYDEENRNERLLELAKLDFNTCQTLHLEEMKTLSLWWKNLNIGENLKYGRDCLLEVYIIWSCGQYFGADQYSRARKMMAKLYSLIAPIDDTFDVYGTYEECKLLNEAIQRWDEKAVDLPMYLRNLCQQFIKTVNSFDDELEPSEKYRLPHIIKSAQTLIDGYMQEVEWRVSGYVPSFHEREKPAIDGHVGSLVVGFPLLGTPGDQVITKEVFQWLYTFPDVTMDCMRIIRYTDDVVTQEREIKSEQGPNTIQCYQIEHKLTNEETTAKFQSFCEDAWKRVNQACLHPADVPRTVLEIFVNQCRQMETFYVYFDDALNKPSNMKKISSLLLLEPFAL